MKKQQHYIWRYYLRPWTLNDQIWCLRNKKMFITGSKNIGQEKFFYQAIPLNGDEINWILKYIRLLHPTAHKTTQRMLENYLICSISSDITSKEGIEEYHTIVESDAIEILNRLYEKDISFLLNEKLKFNFSSYIGFQYTRTKKMRNNLIKMFRDLILKKIISNTIRPDVLAKAMSFISPDPIGNWVCSEAKISFIENNSNIEFITGDQPIINTKIKIGSKEPPEEMELYYPITPRIAILINEKDSKNIQMDNDKDATRLNDLIANMSHNQLYANNEKMLNNYLN